MSVRRYTARRIVDLWLPEDHNLKAWTFDPLTTQNSDSRIDGASLRLVRCPIPVPMTVSQFVTYIFRSGSGLTANQNFMALFSLAGATFTRLRESGDLSGVWNTGGMKYIPMTGGAITLLPPDIWIGHMANGTTLPATYCYEMPAGLQNAGLDGGTNAERAKFRVASFGSGLTALPTSFDISAVNSHHLYHWAALR